MEAHMAIIVEENPSQPLNRSDAEDDEIPRSILEAAQDFIADESNRWSRNSDGAGSELDLENVGVHFKPLDVIVTNCRQVWLIVLTDDTAGRILNSTIVFEGEVPQTDGLD
jgi:hypothetical protein